VGTSSAPVSTTQMTAMRFIELLLISSTTAAIFS
jgi:hypothetical protein